MKKDRYNEIKFLNTRDKCQPFVTEQDLIDFMSN